MVENSEKAKFGTRRGKNIKKIQKAHGGAVGESVMLKLVCRKRAVT